MNENNNTQTAAPQTAAVDKGWWTSPSGHYVGGLLENLKGIADATVKAVANGASAGYEAAKATWASATAAAASGQKTVGEYVSAAWTSCCQAASRASDSLQATATVLVARTAYVVNEMRVAIAAMFVEAGATMKETLAFGGIAMFPLVALLFFPVEPLAIVAALMVGIYFALLIAPVLAVAIAVAVAVVVLAGTILYTLFEGVVDACVAAVGSERVAAPVFA